MKIIACKTPNEVAAQTLIELRRIAHGALSLFVPTGATPKPIYAALAAEKSFWSERLQPIQIDEFIDDRRIFHAQLEAELLVPLQITNRARLIDPRWTEVQMFDHIDRVLSAPLDCALLGLGPNGHVGFHEPGYPPHFVGGRLKVREESRTRVVGAETNEVYTFGVGAFMKAREILLVVIGESKREILQQVLVGADASLPGAFLKRHPALTVISDVISN